MLRFNLPELIAPAWKVEEEWLTREVARFDLLVRFG